MKVMLKNYLKQIPIFVKLKKNQIKYEKVI